MGHLKRYLVEREIPGIGGMSIVELCGAARASNQAIVKLGPAIQWQHSYVAGDRTYCIYLADGVVPVFKLMGGEGVVLFENMLGNLGPETELKLLEALRQIKANAQARLK